jgi:Undecaprenyl-phosphate galactose phosphotransferase WbaP
MMSIFGSGRLRSFSLLFSDIVSVSLALFWGFYSYWLCGAKYEMTITLNAWPIVLMIVLFNIAGRLYCGNLIYPGLVINPVEELRRLMISAIGSFLLFFAFLTLTRENLYFSRLALTISAMLSLVTLPVGRIVIRYILWKFRIAYIPAVIAGDIELAKSIIERMQADDYAILKIYASNCGGSCGSGIPDLSREELLEFARKKNINYLIYCNSGMEYDKATDSYMPEFLYALVVNKTARFPVLWSYPVSFYHYFSFEVGNRMLRKGVLLQKRILEVVLAIIGLILAFLPGVILAVLVKLSSEGPAFYRAKRLGKNGKPISVLKFRTMVHKADQELERILSEDPDLRDEWEAKFKLDNDPRVTKVGRFLRKTSLDELPQFWNVIKGEMSLIGPRPIVPAEVKYYGKDYETFSSVKPGITGLWQVSGRSSTDYEERVELDVFYVNNWSIWMDFYIMFATINAVLLQRGAK